MYLLHSACHRVFTQQRFIDFTTVTLCSILNTEWGGYLRKREMHLQKFAQCAGVEEFWELGSHKISNNIQPAWSSSLKGQTPPNRQWAPRARVPSFANHGRALQAPANCRKAPPPRAALQSAARSGPNPRESRDAPRPASGASRAADVTGARRRVRAGRWRRWRRQRRRRWQRTPSGLESSDLLPPARPRARRGAAARARSAPAPSPAAAWAEAEARAGRPARAPARPRTARLLCGEEAESVRGGGGGRAWRPPGPRLAARDAPALMSLSGPLPSRVPPHNSPPLLSGRRRSLSSSLPSPLPRAGRLSNLEASPAPCQPCLSLSCLSLAIPRQPRVAPWPFPARCFTFPVVCLLG